MAASRRSLLAWATLAVILTSAGCARTEEEQPAPGGRGAGHEPTTATTPTSAVTEVDVDMTPARTVAVALATGNQVDASISPYLTGQAVEQAEQIIAAGQATNEQTLSRFGTVHHATTLDAHEKAEHSSVNGVTMLTVITFGWDAPPEETDLPEATRGRVTPGSPGTRAWYFTLDAATGLIGEIRADDTTLSDFD